MFFKNKVIIDTEETGGEVNRTIRLEIKTGEVFVKTSGNREIKV
jgi:chemotaxis protein CheD